MTFDKVLTISYTYYVQEADLLAYGTVASTESDEEYDTSDPDDKSWHNWNCICIFKPIRVVFRICQHPGTNTNEGYTHHLEESIL